MSTKIDSVQTPAIASSPARLSAVAGRETRGSSDSAPVSGVDQLHLTGDARLLQQLESAVAQIPVADHSRVERIRAQIENGSYTINPQAIASALTRLEWQIRGP